MKKLKFVVTGGAGLIGSWVVDKLLEEFDKDIKEIVVLDNFTRGQMANLENALKSKKVRVVEGDIRDQETVNRLFKKTDYVIHEAAIRITQCAEDPRLCNEVLVDGTFNVLEACVKNKVKKLVFNSSASVYGDPTYLPMDENHPYNNLTAYGAAKIATEHMARTFREMYGLDYVCLRPFNVYGPRMDIYGVYTEVLIRWLDRIDQGLPPLIFGDGQQTMDFVYVEDVARATIAALKSNINEGCYNVGTGRETSLNQLLATLLNVTHSNLKPEHAPQRKVNNVLRRQAGIENSKKDLKFTAKTSIEKGLLGLIEWRKEQIGTNTMKIPITKVNFDEREELAVINTLRSGWVTQGPKVAEFEKSICEYIGVKYAVATTSATTALFLSLYLLEIGPGDEVIVPSFSFIATANVVIHAGATPVFVDIDPKTYNIDPNKIEAAITKKTKAIIPVDQVGLPCDMPRILEIAKKYKLYVIEDAACALGSTINSKKIGSFGEIAAFSFHPRKTITTGEGGIIVTNNPQLEKKLRMLRHHGMSISDVARHHSKKVTQESYPMIGFNFRMSDIQASVGVEQMKKLPALLDQRLKLANRYTEIFQESKLLIPPFVPVGFKHNYQSYIIRLRSNKITRNNLMQVLLDKGIATRIGVMAAHLEPAYRKILGKIPLPETESANKETITIPLFASMSIKEQDYVIKNIKQAVGEINS